MPALLQIREGPPPERREVHCIEIYLPKRLKHLSELYEFLRARTTEPISEIALEGFSIYEVDGVFRGQKELAEERSLVIRILFVRGDAPGIEAKIKALGRQIADTVATTEEEIWIAQYSHIVAIFRPTKLIT